MSIKVNAHISAQNAQRIFKSRSEDVSSSLKKISSGKRINTAADDATALAISEKLNAKILGSRMAERNSSDAISMLQVAEGGMSVINNNLIRLREIAVQAGNDTITDSEREMLNFEYQHLKLEIDRIAHSMEWNGVKLLNGTADSLEIQIGLNNKKDVDRLVFDPRKINSSVSGLFQMRDIFKPENNVLKRKLKYIGSDPSYHNETERKKAKYQAQVDFSRHIVRATMGEGVSINVRTKEKAQSSLKYIDSALQKLAGNRAEIGSLHKRLEHIVSGLQEAKHNQSATNSRLQDTDIAKESSKKTQAKILSNYNVATMAQVGNMGKNIVKIVEGN